MKTEYIVEMTHITKTFPGVRALDDVSFNLKSGEVLALLGENGAGKSTLMKVLSGVYTRDGGEITAFGNKVEKMTPKRAKELGIAIIHQELNLCSHLSVAENIFLGQEIVKGGVVQRKQMNDEARAILKRLSLEIEPETLVGSLSVSKQQMIEIAKALLHKARVLTQITCIYQLLRLILQPQHHSFLPSSTPAAVPHASAREPLYDDTPQTAAAVLRDAIFFVFSFGCRLS